MSSNHNFRAVQCDPDCGCDLIHLMCQDKGCGYSTVADGWAGCNRIPITLEDLQKFLAYVEAHKEDYDDFNVANVQVVLGSLMHYLEAKDSL